MGGLYAPWESSLMQDPLDEPRSVVVSMELALYFPKYRTLERLHGQLVTKRTYSGIGPGSVIEALLNWVLVCMTYTDDTVHENKLPDFNRNNKDIRTYEKLFIEYGIVLWKRMPLSLQKALLLHSKHGSAVILIAQKDSRWTQHELALSVKPAAFYRYNQTA